MARQTKKNANKLVIIGPGRWGSALGSTFAESFSELIYLGRKSSPKEWKEALSDKPLCLIATPFKEVRKVLQILSKKNISGVINASKGIDRNSLTTFSGMAKKYLKVPYASLSGPSFAKELKEKKPTVCVLAGKNKNFVRRLSKKLSTSYFRVYSSSDPIGVDACGALKNVFAIACGVSDGLGLGSNSRAALLARALHEMSIMVKYLGGKSETVFGLAGVGDLWLTATGDKSRNRMLGLRLAKGQKISAALNAIKKSKGPSEGFYTVRQVYKLSKKYKLVLPICEQVYRLCNSQQKPKQAIAALMMREIKAEKTL